MVDIMQVKPCLIIVIPALRNARIAGRHYCKGFIPVTCCINMPVRCSVCRPEWIGKAVRIWTHGLHTSPDRKRTDVKTKDPVKDLHFSQRMTYCERMDSPPLPLF